MISYMRNIYICICICILCTYTHIQYDAPWEIPGSRGTVAVSGAQLPWLPARQSWAPRLAHPPPEGQKPMRGFDLKLLVPFLVGG